MKQMGCTEVTPLARLGVFSMSGVAREDNALMNYVFFQKPAPVSASFDIAFHALCRHDCLSVRGQASIESYELICN